jgi:signal transduction histidine kinase
MRNGNKPAIWITTSKEDEQHVKIAIKDNGIGMSPEVKAKIFDPFFTTKDVGKGTGLGLSIVFKIIEAHNGTIDVHTEPGLGTEFVITLPLSQN